MILFATASLHASEPATQPASRPDAVEITDDKAAIASPQITLTVMGLSCPQCSGNVERQLKRIPAISTIAIDLGVGVVKIRLNPSQSVTRRALAKAIDDAGYTLVKVTVP